MKSAVEPRQAKKNATTGGTDANRCKSAAAKHPFTDGRSAEEKRREKIEGARMTRASRAMNDARRALNYLTRLAGNADGEAARYAAKGLVALLIDFVGNLEMLAWGAVAKKKNEALAKKMHISFVELLPSGAVANRRNECVDFEQFARRIDAWPVLYSAHNEKRRVSEELVTALNLAADIGLNVSGKPFSLWKPANRAVLGIHAFVERARERRGEIAFRIFNGCDVTPAEQIALSEWIRQHARTMPRLSRAPEALRAWKAAGNELLPLLFGAEFQTHPDLAPIAESDKSKLHVTLQRWEQRKLIKRSIGDAWESVARDDGGE